MDKSTIINIRKRLKIDNIDTKEELVKYKKYKKVYTPIFLGAFILSFILMIAVKLHPDFALWALFLNVFIFGEIDRRIKIYEVGEILKQESVNVEEVKKRLFMEGIKDVHKVYKTWIRIGKFFAPFYVLLWIGAIALFVTSIYVGLDLRGVASSIWIMGVNYMLYSGIRYRQTVYEIGIMLE